MSDQMPAFTPATPVAPQTAPAPEAPKRTRKAAKRTRKAAAKKAPRKARSARKAAANGAAPTRRGRTAALTMDVATALALASTVKKKEVGAIQLIVQQLNPLPAKARLRVMQAVADILK